MSELLHIDKKLKRVKNITKIEKHDDVFEQIVFCEKRCFFSSFFYSNFIKNCNDI